MAKNTALRTAALVAVSFTALAIVVIVLLGKHVITFQMALLMLIALLGLYLGFGVLIAVHRFTDKLE